MTSETPGSTPQPTRLLPWLVSAGDDGPMSDSIMLCEISEGEIQTVSLRVAADVAKQLFQEPLSEN